ncbi:hypothetical protein LNQ03_16480 [Klebsiella pneumoniae subsp. pneumoniae]|nr:hypothetical protein [Klebsiella pneumoniae subsp. pneumoniae]
MGKVLWRILIFYVGAIFVIVTIFPMGSNRLQWQPVRTDVCQNPVLPRRRELSTSWC